MKNLFNKLFLTKDGHFVVAQKPNTPIIAALMLYIVSLFPLKGIIIEISYLGSNLAIIYWSMMEFAYGVNLFRKILGTIVFSIVLYNVLAIYF